jgi:sirohydrochlorin ferrochelatase
MKALVLVAHGSRRQASNEEVIALSGVIAREMKDDYPIVEAGFLELAEPSIPEALDRCVRQGATDICIVPYFLSAGRHVHEDIPGEVDKVRTMHANTHDHCHAYRRITTDERSHSRGRDEMRTQLLKPPVIVAAVAPCPDAPPIPDSQGRPVHEKANRIPSPLQERIR